MANIRIPQTSGTISIANGAGKKITLSTKDKYVPEDIDVYVQPQSGSFSNMPTNNVIYAENTSSNTVIATSGSGSGYLYLNEGWFNNTMISLGHLIPGAPPAGSVPVSTDLRVGFVAYDENGGRIQGGMVDVTPSFDGGVLTVSASVAEYTEPSVNVTITGKLAPHYYANGETLCYAQGLGEDYGVTTGTISGTEGTDYLSIDANRVATNGSVRGGASASTTAVQYNGQANGYINVADNTQTIAAQSDTAASEATTIIPLGTDQFPKLSIPIVKTIPVTGGEITQGTATANATVNTTNVTVSTNMVYPSGQSGTTYGIVELTGAEAAPADSIVVSSAAGGTASASGTATIHYSRDAVKLSGDMIGAIRKLANTTVLAASTGDPTFTTSISGTSSAINKTGKRYYIPIVTPNVEGGDLSMSSTISMSGTQSLTVGTQVSINKGASSTGGWTGTVTLSTYGITSTQPSSERQNYVRFLPGQNGSNQTTTISGSITAGVTNIILTEEAGATRRYNAETVKNNSGQTTTATGSRIVTATAGEGQAYYVPVVTVSGTATPTNTVTNPVLASDMTAAFNSGSSLTVPGFLNSAPASGNYITITPSNTVTPGSVTSTTSSITVNAGLTAGGTISGATDTDSIGITQNRNTSHYIAVYGGSYSISDIS